MANSNGWGDGAANNAIGWGQGANNTIGWGKSHSLSNAGLTDIVGFATDTDANSFLSAAAITSATQQAAIDNLVKGLKTDGIWTKMKAIYPFATDNRNLSSYTEDYSNNANWGRAVVTTTANTIISPNGNLNASTATTTTNINNAIYNASPVATSTNQTFTNSIYLKYNNAKWVTLEIWRGDGQTGIRLWVDIQNGVLGTANATIGSYTSSSITNVGNGWYRVSVTGIMPNATAVYLALRHVDGDGAYNFTAVNGKSTYIWGAQSEVGTLTAYQPIATTQQAYISNQFKYNLKDPRDLDAAFRLVFNGGWTHSSNGATPNGTNGYADTKFIPSTSFSSNNNSFGVYSRTDNVNGENFMGTSTATANRLFMYVKFTVLGASQFNHNSQTFASPLLLNSSGYFHSNRIAAGTHKVFVNGALNTTSVSNEQGLSTVPIFLSSSNLSGTASGFSNRQLAFVHFADGLTDTEAANLYTRVQAFQTALSRQV